MPTKAESSASQKFIEIRGIKNDTAILKNGGLRHIVVVSGINFDLKSSEEQEIIINGFQDFLNSLNFSLQIFIHSRKINIDHYLDSLDTLLETETNELLKTQIAEYREFVRAFVSQNAIMNKTYFVVVPFDPVTLPGSAGGQDLTKKVLGMFGKSATVQTAQKDADKELDLQIEQLRQRTASVISSLNQIGLRAVQLNEEEIIELFYNLYNPEAVEKEKLEILGKGAEEKSNL